MSSQVGIQEPQSRLQTAMYVCIVFWPHLCHDAAAVVPFFWRRSRTASLIPDDASLPRHARQSRLLNMQGAEVCSVIDVSVCVAKPIRRPTSPKFRQEQQTYSATFILTDSLAAVICSGFGKRVSISTRAMRETSRQWYVELCNFTNVLERADTFLHSSSVPDDNALSYSGMGTL